MSIEGEVRSLQGVPMFRDVDPAKLKLLAFASERLAYEAGEVLFREDAPSDSVFVVLDGEVEVSLRAGEGRVAVARLPRGAIVGEMGVLCDVARTASVEAVQATVALRISGDVFFELLREFPQMALAVMRDLARRLDRTNDQLAAMAKRAEGRGNGA